mmetsp:Transcript_9760/g.22929  ORF Transcript_9760/g.22929 Transcript_9760/m.22929 type:complete len:217 (-) Transcript_9760:302-952(-)
MTPASEPVLASAYVGSTKNLKDLKDLGNMPTHTLSLRLPPLGCSRGSDFFREGGRLVLGVLGLFRDLGEGEEDDSLLQLAHRLVLLAHEHTLLRVLHADLARVRVLRLLRDNLGVEHRDDVRELELFGDVTCAAADFVAEEHARARFEQRLQHVRLAESRADVHCRVSRFVHDVDLDVVNLKEELNRFHAVILRGPVQWRAPVPCLDLEVRSRPLE